MRDNKASHVQDEREESVSLCHIQTHDTEKDGLNENKEGVADFEKAIKETGYGKFNYLVLLLAFPASCSSNFTTTALSYALPTATCDLQLDAYDRGYLNGVTYAGMISTAFLWGFLSDKYGRKKTLVVGYMGDVIFSVATCFSQDFWSLLFFKFFSGVMICGPFSIFMTYLSELFHINHRDSAVMVIGLFQSVGSVFQPVLAWAIIPLSIKWEVHNGIFINSWRIYLLVCAVPSLVSGLSMIFSHESPRFLLAHGHEKKALHVFQSMYSTNTGKPVATYSVKKLLSEPVLDKVVQKPSFWQEITALFRPPHWTKALLVFSIQFGALAIFNTLRLWLPQLFFFVQQSSGKDDMNTCDILRCNFTVIQPNCDEFKVDTSVYKNMIYVNVLTAMIFGVSTVIVSKIGKKNLIVSLFLLEAAVICALGWVRPPLTIALAATFIALSHNACIGILGFAIQMFPTNVRTMAVSLTMMFGRIGVCLGNGVLPFFLSFSCPITFIGVSGISLICAITLQILASLYVKN